MSSRSFFIFAASSDPAFRWRPHRIRPKSDRNPVPSEHSRRPPDLTMTTRERTEATFFVDSFFLDPSVLSRAFLVFLVVLRSSPKNSVLPSERKSFLHLLRDPEGLVFPDLSGTFFSPSSDMLKQGGRKRSTRLARGKLKNFLVSNNQSKPVRICPEIQINDSSAFFVRSSNLSLEAKLKCLCLISPRGEKGGGKEK